MTLPWHAEYSIIVRLFFSSCHWNALRVSDLPLGMAHKKGPLLQIWRHQNLQSWQRSGGKQLWKFTPLLLLFHKDFFFFFLPVFSFRYAPSHSSSTAVVRCLLQLMDMFLITQPFPHSPHNNTIRNITYWSLPVWLETQKFSHDYVTKRKSFVYIRKLFMVSLTVPHPFSYPKYLKDSSKFLFFFFSLTNEDKWMQNCQSHPENICQNLHDEVRNSSARGCDSVPTLLHCT